MKKKERYKLLIMILICMLLGINVYGVTVTSNIPNLGKLNSIEQNVMQYEVKVTDEFIYYIKNGDLVKSTTDGKSKETIATDVSYFSISGKTIYYSTEDSETFNGFKDSEIFSCNLDGSNNKYITAGSHPNTNEDSKYLTYGFWGSFYVLDKNTGESYPLLDDRGSKSFHVGGNIYLGEDLGGYGNLYKLEDDLSCTFLSNQYRNYTSLSVVNDYEYYVNASRSSNLYRRKLDGTDVKMLAEYGVRYAMITPNKIYFSRAGHGALSSDKGGVFSMNLDGSGRKTIYADMSTNELTKKMNTLTNVIEAVSVVTDDNNNKLVSIGDYFYFTAERWKLNKEYIEYGPEASYDSCNALYRVKKSGGKPEFILEVEDREFIDIIGGNDDYIFLNVSASNGEVNCNLFTLKVNDSIKLNVNNKEVQASNKPIQENDSILVPLRVIGDELNAKINYDSKTKKISITKGKTTIELTMNSKAAKVNGKLSNLTIAPKMVNGTTYIPLRFVGDALSCEVNWDQNNMTVLINEK